MKIREYILTLIRNDFKTKRELAYQLDVSEVTIARYLKENAKNGDLTKIKAIRIISERLGKSFSEILEEE